MLTISPAIVPETDIVVGLLTEAALWLQSRGLPTWNPDTLLALMSAAVQRGEVYLARINDQPVGTVSIQWSDPMYWGERPDDAGYIHKLAITRAAAGQRIGVQLLSRAERLIADQERPIARLDCHAENPTINRFYQAVGYQLRGNATIRGVPLSLYEKRILPASD